MRAVLCTFAFALGLGCGLAQEPKKDDKPVEKAKDPGKEKLAEMEKAISGEMDGLRKEFEKLDKKDTEGRDKIIEKAKAIQRVYADKALTIAKDHIKDESGYEAMSMAMGMGDEKTITAAGELAAANYADSDKINNVIGMLTQVEGGAKALEAIAAKATKKEVKAFAGYALIESETNANDTVTVGKGPTLAERVAKFDALVTKLDALVKEHGDVEIASPRGKMKVAKAAESQKYVLQNLVVGRKAPDVECEIVDLKDKDAKEPKKGKLSDYAGKVVVLDIWATWCGPCVRMIPHEREMIAARKDKKFAFISVSADQQRKELTDFLEKNDMPWTQWWDGGAKSVQEKYKVEFFPNIFVIDHKGIIRYKQVRDKKMDEAVDALLKEMESGGQ